MRLTPTAFAALFAGLFSVAACGNGGSTGAPAALAAPRGEVVYVDDGSVISVLDGATGQVVRRMPGGAPSPGWDRLYSVASSSANVQLRVVDAATGAITRALSVPAWVDTANLSANGHWLALTGEPDPKAPMTRFQVRETDFAAAPVDVELAGPFLFDGLSNDGRRLFLLQLRPDGSYLVRLYDVAAGRLVPGAIVDKTDGSSVMSGSSVSSLTTSDGQEQLTLYEGDSRHQSFVHVLPVGTAAEFAYCVDLPAPGTGWTLTAAPGGRRFFATNMESETVVTITAGGLGPPQVSSGRLHSAPGPFALVRDAEAKEPGPGGSPPAAVSADGRTLFAAGGDGVVRVDAWGLRKEGVARLSRETVLSLTFAPSGWLYAMTTRGEVLRIDPASMRVAWRSGQRFEGGSILRAAPSTTG